MPDMTFQHPAGPVTLHDVQVEAYEATVRVIGMIDALEWERLEADDVFGVHSRRRAPRDFEPAGVLRLTVEGTRDVLYGSATPAATGFVIVEVQRSATLPSGEQAWYGAVFAAPPAWHGAAAALGEIGYLVDHDSDGDLDVEVQLANSEGTVVQIVTENELGLATVAVTVDLTEVGSGGIDPSLTPVVLDVINSFNASTPVGAVALEGSTLVVRTGFPITSAEMVAPLVEALAVGLVRLADFLADPIGKLAAGEISAVDARVALLD